MTKRKKVRVEQATEAPAHATQAPTEAERASTEARDVKELPSARELLRSTAIAAVVALVVLLVAVLPAEYGTDPTGLGRVLGLTQMGETKLQLAREASQDAAPKSDSSPPLSAPAPGHANTAPPATSAGPAASPPPDQKSDVTKVTLGPGQSTEIKLAMSRGDKATYKWTVEGGEVNFDLHADRPGGIYHGYKKGKGASADEGDLVAAFNGFHGWFWRNKSAGEVTITLETRGDYTEVKKMK